MRRLLIIGEKHSTPPDEILEASKDRIKKIVNNSEWRQHWETFSETVQRRADAKTSNTNSLIFVERIRKKFKAREEMKDTALATLLPKHRYGTADRGSERLILTADDRIRSSALLTRVVALQNCATELRYGSSGGARQ
jgi:hypothetical protein